MTTNTNIAAELKNLLREILQAFTNHHGDIEIDCIPINSNGVRLILTVNRAEQSKVVGKQGKRINALVGYFDAVGDHLRQPVRLMLDEPHKGKPSVGMSEPNKWDGDAIMKLVDKCLAFVGVDSKCALIETDGCVTFEIAGAGCISRDTCENLSTVFSAVGKSRDKILKLDFIE